MLLCIRLSLALALLSAVLAPSALAQGYPAGAQAPIVKNILPSLIPGVDVTNYPKVDGSTSTIPVGDLMAARAAGLKGQLCRFSQFWGTSVAVAFPLTYTDQELAPFNKMSKGVFQGTDVAYMNLIAPQKTLRAAGMPAGPTKDSDYMVVPQRDVILVAREPSEDELKAAKEKGVQFDVRPVALDAFVFLVNKSNPVKSLTLGQIKDIYTGKVKKWGDIGGTESAIKPFTRERNSGSQELMEKLVLKGQPCVRVDEMVLYSMTGPIEKVAGTEDAIAYSVYYYEHVMNPNRNNRLIAINGVMPSSETIASRNYPLLAEVYVVTRKGTPETSPAIKLRDWLLSDDGQRMIAESGYVPIRRLKEQK